VHTQNTRQLSINLTPMDVKCLKLKAPKMPKIRKASHPNFSSLLTLAHF